MSRIQSVIYNVTSNNLVAISLAPSLPLGYPTDDAQLTFGELHGVIGFHKKSELMLMRRATASV